MTVARLNSTCPDLKEIDSTGQARISYHDMQQGTQLAVQKPLLSAPRSALPQRAGKSVSGAIWPERESYRDYIG